MIRSVYFPMQFRQPGGTSRGLLTEKDSWFLIDDESGFPILGEVSILKGLSLESREDVQACLDGMNSGLMYPDISSVCFALEMVSLQRDHTEAFRLFHTPFTDHMAGIPINGLIWMGSRDVMYNQIKTKLSEGYRCLKLKIGAIDFDEELELLSYVRRQFTPAEIELRVDANGAFTPAEALTKLQRLSEYQLHSIEQPIMAGQWESMAALCQASPLDIALDEELIAVRHHEDRFRMLETIRPQYIILKPSLIGGFAAADEWIALADTMHIGWWATSALESNIGLNAIAQWVSAKETHMPQGLGTGQLFTNNIDSPLSIRNGHLFYEPAKGWDYQWIEALLL